MSFAPSIPAQNFTCLTRLDHERLRAGLAERVNSNLPLGVEAVTHESIRDVAIFGNHSSTQTPYIGVASMKLESSWIPLTDILSPDDHWFRHELVPKIQTRGAAIIRAMQVSSALSAACAIVKHLQDWLLQPHITRDVATSDSEMFSMGVLSTGNPYGIQDGLVYSFPMRWVHDSESFSLRIRDDLTLDDETRRMMAVSASELLDEKKEAEAILGTIITL